MTCHCTGAFENFCEDEFVVKSGFVILTVLAVAGAWFFCQHYQIQSLDDLPFLRRPSETVTPGTPPVKRQGETIRIASFNIQVLGPTKMGKPHVVDQLARVIRKFDIVAVQEVRSRSDDIIPQLVETVNAAGRHYDYVIGPRLGRTQNTEQYAFIFDTASVEVDRTQLYTIEDPNDLLHRPPLVAWFRVRGPAPEEAFTFSLVNLHLDPDEVQRELDVLDEVFRLVRDDQRQEDDVVLLGDFNAEDRSLGPVLEIPSMIPVVQGMPTNTRANRQYDNIVLHKIATSEFTGKGSVYDFMREYNLTLQSALEVSDHLPVWAEFSIYEGGIRGAVGSERAQESAAATE